jgi:hypothetical protein
MSEGGQQLPLVAKAAHEFFAGQVRGHHFERDGLVELPVGAPCQIYAPMPPLNPAAARSGRDRSAARGPATQPRSRLRQRRPAARPGLRAEFAMPPVRGQKGPHLFANRRIEAGLRSEPRFAFGFRLLQRGMKQLLHALPEWIHVRALQPVGVRAPRKSAILRAGARGKARRKPISYRGRRSPWTG